MCEKTKELQRIAAAICGTLFFSMGISFFIVPAGMYSGGILGISQVICAVFTDIINRPLSGPDVLGIVYYLLNIPVFILTYRELGRKFYITTIICVTIQTIFFAMVPANINLLGADPFGSAIIGGVISGGGTGITLCAGGSGGGQDILGIYIMKKNKKFSVGKISLLINFCVYTACALLYDLRIVIYSLVYAVVSSYATDKVIFMLNESFDNKNKPMSHNEKAM